MGGRALYDDGLVIDLSAMRFVHVDSTHRAVRVQGGATLGELDRETASSALRFRAASSQRSASRVSLSAWVGSLLRRYGMSIDDLLSCQVVTADGQMPTAVPFDHEDLFWGLRGGGGNFGIVTSFEFKAHPVHAVFGGLLLYPRDVAVDVIRHFRDYVEAAPDDLTAYAALLHAPDGAPLVG